MSIIDYNLFAVLGALNYTANCTLASAWLSTQGSTTLLPTADTLNTRFIRCTLSPTYSFFKDEELEGFYTNISVIPHSIWYEDAVDQIISQCLAPNLARSLTFEDLDLTQNCTATDEIYKSEAPRDSGLGTWIYEAALRLPLNSSEGLIMLRNSLPSTQINISDALLRHWADFVFPAWGPFDNVSPSSLVFAKTCHGCMLEFCEAAGFAGNPDVAGIEAVISYIMGAAFVTLAFLGWIVSRVLDTTTPPWKPIRTASITARDTLIGGAMCSSLALIFAFFAFFYSDSYYERLIAQDVAFASSNTLIIVLGTTRRLSSKFTRLWLVGLVFASLVQVLALITLLLALVGTTATDSEYWNMGDEACFKNFIKSSLLHNPLFYSISWAVTLFFMIAIVTALMVQMITWRFFSNILQWLNKIQAAERLRQRLCFLEKWSSYLGPIISTLCLPLLWLEIYYILQRRKTMLSVSGPT
ncbi:hypothetical protein DL98DRAFT_542053 [Cadophora sp. DSE1049]|nr:hypothetical protein DL98DRAFT_542053 [Cadophora sp. DSE1049]